MASALSNARKTGRSTLLPEPLSAQVDSNNGRGVVV